MDRLLCSQEAYDLVEFLLERKMHYSEMKIRGYIENLLASPRSAGGTATAGDTIPDPAAAQRARAWLVCLPFGNQAAKAP